MAITPAAGFVSPLGAIGLGAIAALPSYFGLVMRARTGLDDSLDVIAAHGIGGTVGALLTGVLASKAWNGTVDGSAGQLGIQAVGILAAIAYSGVASFLLLKLIGLAMPLKVALKEEGLGLDVSQHGEEAYADDDGAILILQRDATPQKQGGPALAPAPAGGGRS